MSHKKAKVSTKRTVRAPKTTRPSVQEELERKHGHRAKPISLYPLDFETALEGLLAVKWPPAPKQRKKRRKS
jgi:hypothetical protein